ncbi:UNVERIFIED_CONTAM: Auxin transport protein BIG [Sesamum radiatum]|uniref:Auxin transport protein BIG n=1 Tax=Sesamum radiatum TaxID=300843 RepID=A0AAW2RDA4_SESRA
MDSQQKDSQKDSQQKDSLQQMIVSLPGPSCKINRKIALLGVLYGEKCKAAFDSVSKSVQTLQGLRRVLMNYLHQKHSDNLAAASRFVVLRSPNSCYGCASTFVTQCLEILQVLSKHPSSKKQLVASGILRELFENNIHQGPKTARVQARAALCAFSEGDANAVAELNSLLQKKVVYCLEHHRSMDIALATREELMLLSDVCSLADEFWESRLRIVFQLLFKSIKLGAKHPAISEHVILPCLKIISHACTPPKPDAIDKDPAAGKPTPVSHLKDENSSYESGSSGLVSANRSMPESLEKNWDGASKTQDIQLLSYSEWEKGASYLDFVRRQYKVSQAGRVSQKSRPQRYDYLAMKYALRWKRRCKAAQSEIKLFELGSWVTELILSACSQSIRSEMCMLINLLCGQSSSRRFRLLNLLIFMRDQLLSDVLEALIVIRGLIVQKTKLISDCNRLLKDLLDSLLLEIYLGAAVQFDVHRNQSLDCPPMTVTYRLQVPLKLSSSHLSFIAWLFFYGYHNAAVQLTDHLSHLESMTPPHDVMSLKTTEPMIKELDEDREESQDPERLRDDLKSNQEQLVAVLNLLMLCCKTRENRRALLRLGALGLLLETARRAFSVDAMEPAEGILLIVESLTLEANESDNISVTPGVFTVSSEDAGSSEQAKKIVLMFLERLSHPSGLKKSSKQQRNTEMVARILPYLTYGEPAAMEVLIQHFDPYLQDWGEFDRLQKQFEDNPKDEKIAQQAAKQKFALENFVRVRITKDELLWREIERYNIGERDYWSCCEALEGLSMGHLATQRCIDEEGILPLLHALESVPGENEIGAKAENLLDTLIDKEGTDNGFLAEKVRQLRHTTRDEMRRLALRKREQLLQGLGMRQELTSDGGERIIVAKPVLEGFEDVEEEEDGLACMVCREGYRLRPTDLLGVYTYSKRVNLGVGSSGNARGDCVYTTVSHFNIIHFQCHQEAKRADAALKNPKKEWDGAALRNNETLCNNLFPLRGPSVPMGQYMRYVDQYWDYLNALGRADGSRLRLLTYDIVLMLARFATGASFSADSRGGGKESNAKFLPFMIQMARHLLDHDSSQQNNVVKSITTYLSSPASDSKFSTSPGTQHSAGTEETVQFMMVSSLLSESYESWLQHRRGFLQRGIYHAYMQRHGRSVLRGSPSLPSRQDSGSTSAGPSGETGGSDELFSTIQPMLVYTG